MLSQLVLLATVVEAQAVEVILISIWAFPRSLNFSNKDPSHQTSGVPIATAMQACLLVTAIRFTRFEQVNRSKRLLAMKDPMQHARTHVSRAVIHVGVGRRYRRYRIDAATEVPLFG